MINNNKKQILKLLGVSILESTPIYTREVDFVGCINGFFIFSYSYYWVIKGKMPLKYAIELYNYKDLEIRVDGGSKDNNPIDWCTSDRFKKEYEKITEKYHLGILTINELSKEISTIKKKFIDKDLDSCYIEMYHIDTTEGLRKVVEVIKENNIKTEWY